MSKTNIAVLGRAVGRRRQRQDRRHADAALLGGRAVSGRPQRRAHGVCERQEVRPAPDSVRHPASRRHLRHRQRRGHRSAGAVRGGRRAGAQRHRRRRPAARQREGARHPAVSPRAGRAVGGAPRRAQDRHDVARHRAGLRGQDRAARHPRLRPARRSRGAGRGSARERQRAQPHHQGVDARLEAGLRSAGCRRRADAAVGRRRVAVRCTD